MKIKRFIFRWVLALGITILDSEMELRMCRNKKPAASHDATGKSKKLFFMNKENRYTFR